MSSCSACSHRRFAGSAVAARPRESVGSNSSTGAGASRETVPLRVLFALRVQVVGLERVVGLLLRELVRYRLLPQGGSSGAGPTETRSGSRTGCSITCLVVALNNARFLGSPRHS